MAFEIERRFLIKNDNWKKFINKANFLKEALRPYNELICCHIGNFKNGNSSVYIKNSNRAELLWEEDTPLTGFTHVN